MRIIAGRFRRRTLKAPRGFQTRPSTDRAREALFNLVSSRMELENVRVLDLYAGSGSLGLEALSRGAGYAVFVESDARVLHVARENAVSLGVKAECQFIRSDVLQFFKRFAGQPFDLILADPPYDSDEVGVLPEAALQHLNEDGLFVLEHDVRHSFEDHTHLDVSRAYGRTIVSIFVPGI